MKTHEVISLPKHYRTAGAPETPYLKAKQEWDERLGSFAIQTKNWRLLAIGLSATTILLATGLVFESKRNKVVPVIVAVNPVSGEPTVLGPVETVNRQPGPLEIKYFLSEFIRLVRAVPMDPVLIKQNWMRGYSFLRKDAASLLNEMTNKDAESPLKKIGKNLVSVQPLSVVQIPSTNSYQVRWRESLYAASGTKSDEYTMLGTFSIEIEPPNNEQSLRDNPLGIFITNFQWNRELKDVR